MFQPYQWCRGISTDTDWRDIENAPRDGTPVELENCYGIRPTYTLCRWVNGRGWVVVGNDFSGVIDGPWLRWREYSGDVTKYVDPTGGRQETMEYWQ